MLPITFGSFNRDEESIGQLQDLAQSGLRYLVNITGPFIFLVSYFLALVYPDVLGNSFFIAMLLYIPTWILAVRLVHRNSGLSFLSWMIGVILVIVYYIILSNQPVIGYFLTFIPIIAMMIFGWVFALIVHVLLFAIVVTLAHLGYLPPLTSVFSSGIIFSALINLFLVWGVTKPIIAATDWSLFYMRRARQTVNEVQEKQMEVAQIQEDLIQANQELARLSTYLKAMNQVAEDARKSKEEFVANVSHELRTPLNMIIGFSQMISRSPEIYSARVPPALLADIRTIHRNSVHLSKLVDDILDLSQIEAGKMALIKEKSSIYEIASTAIDTVKPLFDSKNLYLNVQADENIPEILCDRMRIRQVLINLLSNAGRFTDEGGVTITITNDERNLTVSVEDTGPGISPENQEVMFQPFKQGDSSIQREYGGSGLGLSISKRFVEMHQGKMLLESELGRGTKIIFSLSYEPNMDPIKASTTKATRWINPYTVYQSRISEFRAPHPTVRPKLLLVEQDDALSRIIRRYMDNVEIVSTNDEKDALEKIQTSPPSAIIINSPEFSDGSRYSKISTNLPYDIPIITCWVPGFASAAHDLGVVDYLLKPVFPEKITETIKSLGKGIKKILIIDDDAELQQLYTRTLSSSINGYQVIRAFDGQEGLELMRSRKPDLVILDLVTPLKDGFQVLKEKAEDSTIQEIPVIIITSRDPSNDPVVSNYISVSRKSGLSTRDLITSFDAMIHLLNPANG